MRYAFLSIVAGFVAMTAVAAEPITLKGSVMGPDSKPVENAAVSVYLVGTDAEQASFDIRLMGQDTTCSSGLFSVTVEPPSSQRINQAWMVFAEKSGLSIAFAALMAGPDNEIALKMTAPQTLAGRIEDAHGNPVAGASVQLPFLSIPTPDIQGGQTQMEMGIGLEPVPYFSVTTDEKGQFAFTNLSEKCTAEILIRKAGLAPFHSITSNINPMNGCTFEVGQPDIVLSLADPCKITGIVMDPDSHPVANTTVLVREPDIPISLVHKPVHTGPDGTYEFSDMAPGSYTLRVVDPEWISEPVTVEVNTEVGVPLKVGKGSLLTVRVVDGVTDKPVPSANVQIVPQGSSGSIPAVMQSDANGTVQKRVAPGTYNIMVYASGYRSSRSVAAVVEDGKPAEVTVTLGASARITGTVHDPDDRPIAGVQLFTTPSDHTGKTSPLTDDKGHFALGWEPEQNNWTNGEYYIVAVHKERNLAVAERIDADTKEVQLRLMPAETLTGKVLGPDGKGLAGARIDVQFRGSNWSTSYQGATNITTDDNGVYTINGIAPEQRYYVSISGPKGYGTGSAQVEALDDEKTITLPDVTLKLANLTVSGKVVDEDGKPLEGVQLNCYGDGQPNANLKSAKDGTFTFEAVCEGRLTINANHRINGNYAWSNVQTEGGAQDVTVVISPQVSSSSRFVPRQPAPLLGKTLPDLTGYGIALAAEPKPVLVCLWDWRQRPSRYAVRQLAEQAKLLSDASVEAVLLNADPCDRGPLDDWLKEGNIPFKYGMIEKDADNARFNLGVKALPWLILTDADRKVIAEGFELDELKQLLEQLK